MQTQHEDICSKQRCILFYQAGFIFKEIAFVHSAVCTCKAGLSGVCSHVGGLLFTLVKIKNSCTSQVCQWQRPRKITNPPSPKKLADLQFFKTDGADKEIPQKPYPGIYQAGPCNDPDKFLADVLNGLKTACPSSVLYQTMSDAVNINEILKSMNHNLCIWTMLI